MLKLVHRHQLWRPRTLLRYSKAYVFCLAIPYTFRLRFLITGIPKCGTTWMAKILGSVPGVHVEPEGTGLKRDLLQVLLRNPKFVLDDGVTQEYLHRFKEMVLKKALLSGKRIVGDKTPEVLPEPFNAAFPEARVIFLYRDGRDFIVSDAFHNIRMGRAQGDTAQELFWDEWIRKRAPLWRNWVLDVLPRYRRLYGPDLMEIRYEDLLDQSLGLDRVGEALRFTGFDPKLADQVWRATQFEKLSSGRKPGDEDRRSFFRKGIAGDWQNYFTAHNLTTFLEVAEDGLRALNYPI